MIEKKKDKFPSTPLREEKTYPRVTYFSNLVILILFGNLDLNY